MKIDFDLLNAYPKFMIDQIDLYYPSYKPFHNIKYQSLIVVRHEVKTIEGSLVILVI